MMIEALKQEIEARGEQCRFIPIERLVDLQSDLAQFVAGEQVNSFQKYIVSSLYSLQAPDSDFALKSIVIIAVPRPAWAEVEFQWRGRTFPVKSLVRPYGGEDAATAILRRLKTRPVAGHYRLAAAPRLPLKRLAVAGGLAVYGRNNICYVDGMGSFLTLVALVTDAACDRDDWKEVECAKTCARCRTCVVNCPTRAIRDERFLIDNEKCLSYFNESPGEFPAWISPSAHHCVYDCLRCQIGCPLNKEFVGNIIGPIRFDDAETGMLLAAKQFHDFGPDLQKKAALLGMDQYLTVIPRNLKVLFDVAERNAQ
jgi:epoxyqueuosine reductase